MIWFIQDGKHKHRINLDVNPCPTICANGVGDTWGGILD